MFQVASHPTHFGNNMDTYAPAPHATHVPPSVQLPRTLARPTFMDVDRDVILALAPELADVPMEYVRKHLAGQANEMLAALSLLSIPSSLPKSRLTPSIDAPVRPSPNSPSSSAFPTHILAVSSSRSSPSSPNTPTVASFAAQAANSYSVTVPLYPTHALVLASNCSLLPSLPRSRPSNRTASISLPVVPISVPSAETFPLLHAYLHTKRADTLLASLLPSLASSLPPSASTSSSSSRSYVSQFNSDHLLRLAQGLASNAYSQAGPRGALPNLMTHAKVINGVWRNVCALGVFDAELWGIMDLAWEIVLAALTRVVERERS